MGTIVCSGGLGNQMFQYAFYLAKKQNGEAVGFNTSSLYKEAKHNGYELERLFGIKADPSASLTMKIIRKLLIFRNKKYYRRIASALLLLLRLSGIHYIKEKGFSEFNPNYLLPTSIHTFYFGFWQSPKYFESLRQKLLEIFSFEKLPVSEKTRSLSEKIRKTESISLHIRRGDYLSEENKKTYGGICTSHYYSEAIQYMEKEAGNPLFVIFSDDLQWVKENLVLESAVYVDWNTGTHSWEDMWLMSQCKHHIIANSTFSWWGAWLNRHPEKKVIAPEKFMNGVNTPDIYPDNWITIDCL